MSAHQGRSLRWTLASLAGSVVAVGVLASGVALIGTTATGTWLVLLGLPVMVAGVVFVLAATPNRVAGAWAVHVRRGDGQLEPRFAPPGVARRGMLVMLAGIALCVLGIVLYAVGGDVTVPSRLV